MDKEKLKQEYKSKFTYMSGYGVTMEPKSFEKSFEWAWSKIVGRQWTSVKEAVPNNERNLLVLTNEGEPKFYHVAQYFDGTWATHSEILHYVTHWMELPPLPAGGVILNSKTSLNEPTKN